MQHRTIAALADRLRTCIPLSKSRLETLCLLIIGAIGARTVNLGHIATERGGPVQPASTYRRLQRFFQFFGLAPDWAAPLLAATLGSERWTLVLDRTNWKIGRTEVNYLVLAAVTRRKRVPLVWTLLPHGGGSSTSDRNRADAPLSGAFPGREHPHVARRRCSTTTTAALWRASSPTARASGPRRSAGSCRTT
jgi:hypothetical protein